MGVDGQVERFQLFHAQVRKARQVSCNLKLLGDINIDMLENNNQIDKSNIARTMPIYKEILEDNGMSVQNKKPTWFRGNQKLFLTI